MPENMLKDGRSCLFFFHLGEATGVASREGVRQEPRRGLPIGDSCGRIICIEFILMIHIDGDDNEPEQGVQQKHQGDWRQHPAEDLIATIFQMFSNFQTKRGGAKKVYTDFIFTFLGSLPDHSIF